MMMKCSNKAVLLSLCVVFAVACGNEAKTLMEPSFDGKADTLTEVNYRGQLEYGGEAFGEFVNDFQFDGWTFEARAGAVVTIETTQRGTAAQLDNTLFLYGPADEQGEFNDARIARDDDSGWGAHASLNSITLAGEGSYLVVVGTPGGDGRGAYRLVLSCIGDNCQPDVPVVEGCPGDVLGDLEMCMESRIYDDGEMRHVALEDCTGNLPDVYYDQCEYEAVPPEWCGISFETFESEVIPACVAAIDEIIPSDGLDVCDPVVIPYLEPCAEDQMVNSLSSKEQAIEYCVDESTWEQMCHTICERESASWCAYEFSEVHYQMAPDCRAELAELPPLPAPPSAAQLETMTGDAIDSYLSYEDEGYHCDIRDFVFDSFEEHKNADDAVVRITAFSSVEGPINYCAGYTSYQCSTEIVIYDGAWEAMDSDCEDVGSY